MAKYCSNCGSELKEEQDVCLNCGVKVNKNDNTNNSNNGLMQKRDVVTSVILSIITCGIYGIYWFITLTNDSNRISNDNETANGGLAFLYTLITCGIYGFYWSYKMGKKLYEAGQKYNKNISDNSVLYIVLAVLGLQIVNYCIIQSDLNKFAD